MRYKVLLGLSLALLSNPLFAQWKKINDLDYTWGPFKIYNISLFTENGEYTPESRPLMLTLKYDKPVDGRDFAISIARAWSNLGISLKDKDNAIERLRKTLPDLKEEDSLSYIALPDKGYFVLNDQVIPEEFYGEVNNAIVAIWLDPKVDISQALTTKKRPNVQDVHIAEYNRPEKESHFGLIQLPSLDPSKEELKDEGASTEQAVDFEQNLEKTDKITPPAPIKVTQEKPKVEKPIQPKTLNNTEKAPEEAKSEAKSQDTPAQSAEPESAPKQEPVDPKEPEKDIQPIADPIPDNIRTS